MDKTRIRRRTNDCETYGLKHELYVHSAVDQFLVGHIWFLCYNCHSAVMVDRFWFYQAITRGGARFGP